MSNREAHFLRASRTVLPPLSSRTLQHPSFLPLYVDTATGVRPTYPGYPMCPAELFYTDPTLPCGKRIYNRLSGMVCDVSQLNTPVPIMSVCVAPPSRPDPFRARPHPTNNLGSPGWRMPPPQVQPRFIVIQLSQQEDQVITALLKLHHQEAPHSEERAADAAAPVGSPGPAKSNYRDVNGTASFERANEIICIDAVEEGRRWSDAEYEAANSLLGSFQQVEEYLNGKIASRSSESELEGQTFPPLVTCGGSQNGSFIEEKRDEEGDLCTNKGSRSEERMLTDLEGDALQVLLSLADGTTSSEPQ